MNHSRLLFVLIFISLPVCFSQLKYGCKRGDKDFNKCLVKELNGLRPTLKKGIPKIGIPSLDPLTVLKVELHQGNGPVQLHVISTDQIIKGISNYHIHSANIDLKNFKMDFDISIPWLYINGKTEMNGRFLALPITGSGDSWSNYTTVTGKISLTGHPVAKAGKEYFKLEKVKFDTSVKKAVMHLNNLFNGNKELGDAVNKSFEENWEVLFKELKPVIDGTIESIVKSLAGKVFDRYSIQELFPE